MYAVRRHRAEWGGEMVREHQTSSEPRLKTDGRFSTENNDEEDQEGNV